MVVTMLWRALFGAAYLEVIEKQNECIDKMAELKNKSSELQELTSEAGNGKIADEDACFVVAIKDKKA